MLNLIDRGVETEIKSPATAGAAPEGTDAPSYLCYVGRPELASSSVPKPPAAARPDGRNSGVWHREHW